MTKEEVNAKNKKIETDIEQTKELIKFNKKYDKITIFIGGLLFVVMLLVNRFSNDQDFLRIFGISFFYMFIIFYN